MTWTGSNKSNIIFMICKETTGRQKFNSENVVKLEDWKKIKMMMMMMMMIMMMMIMMMRQQFGNSASCFLQFMWLAPCPFFV